MDQEKAEKFESFANRVFTTMFNAVQERDQLGYSKENLFRCAHYVYGMPREAFDYWVSRGIAKGFMKEENGRLISVERSFAMN